MRNQILFLLLLFPFFASCASHSNPIEKNPLGKTYEDSITFRDMVLPLPKGKWKVVGRGYAKNRNFVEICLERDMGNKPDSIIFITRNSLKNSFSGYVTCKYLERENMLYAVSNRNGRGKPQDGWTINHIRLYFNKNSNKANKEAYDHIINNKLVMPGNVIEVYHRFTGSTSGKKFLEYSIYYNPETRGFAAPANSEWASSDWNILKINKDPKKVAYIEKLKREGENFHQKLKECFGN